MEAAKAHAAKIVATRADCRDILDPEKADLDFLSYLYARKDGLCSIAIVSRNYPPVAAHGINSKTLDNFVTESRGKSWPSTDAKEEAAGLKAEITKYQDPGNVDNIMRVKMELDETKVTLHKTIESVLERGQTLDDLVAKSENLSFASKSFYAQAKKQNSCCVLM